ncbi:MAG: cupin domain-containing protein [Anaerovoracaceae bacterium]|jgi:mannose-6-phosphate isomerase-like protein (cupin superfamily)
MVHKERIAHEENFKGGKGPITFYHILEKEDFYGHARLYARIVLPPGSSIGWHVHEHETEPFYILSGAGDFIEASGRTRVGPGDVCTIKPGEGHSIENTGSEDLVFMALVYND